MMTKAVDDPIGVLDFILKLSFDGDSSTISALTSLGSKPKKVRLESLNQEFPKIVNAVDLFLNPKVNE